VESGSLLLDFLRSNPVFTLFLVLGCGYLVGRMRTMKRARITHHG
jgi:hypothetical protein